MNKAFYILFVLIPLLLKSQKTTISIDENKNKSIELVLMIEQTDYHIYSAGMVIGRNKDELLVISALHSFNTINDLSTEFTFTFKNIDADISLKGRIERGFKNEDLAILKADIPEKLQNLFCSLSFNQLGKESTLIKENTVSAVGYGNGEKWSESKRHDDKISSINEKFIFFKSVDIVSGFSGGGLINDDGHLVGMILKTNPPKAYRFDHALEMVTSLGYEIDLDYAFPNGTTRLHDAVQKANTTLVKKYIEDCPEVNIPDNRGSTALHYATDSTTDSAIPLLLKAGFDPRIKDNNGEYPIHYAIANRNKKAVKKLFELHRTFYLDSTNSYGLMQKAIKNDHKIAEYLRGQGVSLAFPEGRDTMLVNAVHHKNLEMVKTLLRYGANPNQRDFWHVGNHTPNLVNKALWQNTPLIAEELIEHGADLSNRESYHTIYWAINNENLKICRAWLKAENNPWIYAPGIYIDSNPWPIIFHIYLSNYNPIIIEEFEAMGYDVNYPGEKGNTLAHYIIGNWDSGPIFRLQPQKYLERFIDLEGDLTIKNKQGKTSLDYARSEERRKEIEEIVQKVKNQKN